MFKHEQFACSISLKVQIIRRQRLLNLKKHNLLCPRQFAAIHKDESKLQIGMHNVCKSGSSLCGQVKNLPDQISKGHAEGSLSAAWIALLISSMLRDVSFRQEALLFLLNVFFGGNGRDRSARTTAVILS